MIALQTMPLRVRIWDDHRHILVPYDEDYVFELGEDDDLQLSSIDWHGMDIVAEDEKRFIVSQDTGLKDKNGKHIFTGDIVKCWDDCKGIVYFDETLLQLRVKFEAGDDEDLASCEAEIVGNIWENPELLGGENA